MTGNNIEELMDTSRIVRSLESAMLGVPDKNDTIAVLLTEALHKEGDEIRKLIKSCGLKDWRE